MRGMRWDESLGIGQFGFRDSKNNRFIILHYYTAAFNNSSRVVHPTLGRPSNFLPSPFSNSHHASNQLHYSTYPPPTPLQCLTGLRSSSSTTHHRHSFAFSTSPPISYALANANQASLQSHAAPSFVNVDRRPYARSRAAMRLSEDGVLRFSSDVDVNGVVEVAGW